MSNKKKAQEALRKYYLAAGSEAGVIHDADTVLADVMADAAVEGYEDSIGLEILQQYNNLGNAEARAAFEALFYSLTGTEFAVYLDRCIEETGVYDLDYEDEEDDHEDEEDDHEDDHFAAFLTDRNDYIDNAAYELAVALTGPDLEWDQEYIGEIADDAEAILSGLGHTVCYPYYEGDEETPCYLGEDCSNPYCPFKKEKRRKE